MDHQDFARRTRRRLLKGVASAVAAVALPVRAQGTNALRLVLPFSPGGPTDAAARSIAASMSNHLGQAIVVENRAGANGAIAATFVARSPADGNTLLYHTSAFTLEAALSKAPAYDPLADFTYVGLTTSAPLVLLVQPDFPARTPADFIARLKAAPGKFNYGAVIRSIVHVAPEQLFHALGAKAVAVPYKGTAPALVDLMAGQLHFAFDAVNSALPHVKGGRVRALAIASRERSPVLPEVMTFAETVLPGFEAGTWGAMMGPAGVPADRIARLHQALARTLQEPAFRGQLESQGLHILGGTPEQCREFVAKDVARWKQVAAATNLPTE